MFEYLPKFPTPYYAELQTKRVGAVCPAFPQSSSVFSNMWECELAQGAPHGAAVLVSLSPHMSLAVLSMQMREGKRGGLSWRCQVSASLLLHFKWINDKSPLFSPSLTALPPARSPFLFTKFPSSLHSSSHPSSLSKFVVAFPWLVIPLLTILLLHNI